MEPSPITNNLLELLEEPPVPGSAPNATSLLQQAHAAEEWLLKTYLSSWLELIGSLVDCDYPVARAFAPSLRALGRLAELLDGEQSPQMLAVHLESSQNYLKSTLRMMNTIPTARDFQWGLRARDVPMAIAYAFDETEFLDALLCKDIAPCCMYAAFLVGQVVTDAGVAEEIESKMFEEMPRQLIELLRALPTAPEA